MPQFVELHTSVQFVSTVAFYYVAHLRNILQIQLTCDVVIYTIFLETCGAPTGLQ